MDRCQQAPDLVHGDDRAGSGVDHAEVALGRRAQTVCEHGVHVGEACGLGGVDCELKPDEEGTDRELAWPSASGGPQEIFDDRRDVRAVDPGDRLAKVSRPDQLARRPQSARGLGRGVGRDVVEEVLERAHRPQARRAHDHWKRRVRGQVRR
jgi:hypothetical protein